MRTTLTLLLGACASMASAQLVNGGFEDGLNGWQEISSPNGEGSVELSNIVPIDGGEFSIAVPIVSAQNGIEHLAVNTIESLAPGATVIFGGWMKPDYIITLYSKPKIDLCTCDSVGVSTPIFSIPYPSNVVGWFFAQSSGMLPDIPEGQAYCIRLSGGLDLANWLGSTLFDNIFAEVDASTGALDKHIPIQPRCIPNPATDRLWIDLPDAVKGITMIDATGRQVPLLTFHHTGRTLEVDVSSVPPGLCVMLLSTPSGLVPVRFLKA